VDGGAQGIEALPSRRVAAQLTLLRLEGWPKSAPEERLRCIWVLII
jgi:hypothetical protein